MTSYDGPERRGPDGMSARVATLEGGFSRLHEDVQGLYRKFDGMSSDITQQLRKFADDKRTNWSTFAAWAGVLLSVFATIGYLTVVPITEVLKDHQSSIREMSRQVADHIASPGHAVALERASQLAREIKELDTVLQREMRLLDQRAESTLQAEVKRLDEILQREMNLLVDANGKTTEALKDRLDRIEANWDRDIGKFLSHATARLDQVDNRLKNITARLRVVESQ